MSSWTVTGALTETILELCEPAAIIDVDTSPGFLGYARTRVTDPQVSFEVAGAIRLTARAWAVRGTNA
jgi:ubiquinone/menaquinone biosynthesis C-methylase UbiE